jgi:bacterioferritin
VGKTGTSIVELNAKELIADLNRALANEWLAAFQYWAAGNAVGGFEGKGIAEFLEEQVEDELEHANLLAKRIVQLGGLPISHPIQLTKIASIPYVEPRARSEARTILANALKVERQVIQEYHALAKKTFGKDPVTYGIVTQILAGEVAEEEEIENLLAKV